MSFTVAEGRQEILDRLAAAIALLATAVATLSVAYERLDEQSSDALEEQLFRPVQLAFGRAQRTYNEFADRSGLERVDAAGGAAGPERQHATELIERAAESVRTADTTIADLQDSMLPVEVGDQELRAGLSETRSLVDHVPALAQQFVRTVGR
ncbi:MAG TPA: hypothetical protein VMD48_02330 [Solirubrobacteraceae bacterium]|nr:hypothetical protein [Solirubrobacteraceae bacterium]